MSEGYLVDITKHGLEAGTQKFISDFPRFGISLVAVGALTGLVYFYSASKGYGNKLTVALTGLTAFVSGTLMM